MSDALRSVFAELGFNIDFAALDKLDGDLKALASVMDTEAKRAEALAKAAADTAKAAAEAAKRAAEEAAEAKKKAAEAAKSGTKEEAAAAKKAAEEKEAAAKKAAEAAKKAAEAAKAAAAAAKDAGKVSADASKEAEEAAKKLAEANKEVATTIKGIATAVGVHALLSFAREFADTAEALRDTARESRVTTSELQGLDHAAVQAGVGVERMRAGLHTFGEALRQGERWGNGTTSTLRRLGIQARDSSGHIRPTVDLMDEVAVAMERVESPTRRARVAQQLFGESGRRMLDVLHSGPGGIRALREELEELGGGVTPEAVEASRQFTQAQERQGRAMDSVRSVLATALLPALSWFLNLSARAAAELSKLTRGTHVAELALVALGVAGVVAAAKFVIAWGAAALPFLVFAAAIGVATVAIDDLIGFVEGADSATGRLIDSMLGAGKSAEAVEMIRTTWAGVKETLDEVEGALNTVTQKFDELKELAEPVLSRINAVRGYLPGFSAAGGEQVGAGEAPPAPDAPFWSSVERPARGGARGPAGTRSVATGERSAGVNVPGKVTVSAPGAVGERVVSRVVHNNHTHGPIHVYGITDPAAAADRVARILDERARAQRDGDHPQEDEE